MEYMNDTMTITVNRRGTKIYRVLVIAKLGYIGIQELLGGK
jgi:hypothetical protein